MPHLKQHEVLDCQEHIRVSAAAAQLYGQMANMAADPDVRRVCQSTAQSAAKHAQQLMSHLTSPANSH